MNMTRIVITGAAGFIGANLRARLQEMGHTNLVGLTRGCTPEQIDEALTGVDFIFHLAGVNRPKDESEFARGNAGFTEELVMRLQAGGHRVPVVLASSTQAELDNAYGRSKRAAEGVVRQYGRENGVRVHLFRLTNVFGRWARPHYNSAVATFCHQVAHGQALTIHNPAAPLRLVYVDDVVSAFTALLNTADAGDGYAEVTPIHETSVGDVAQTIQGFADGRSALDTPGVSATLVRALHTTYLTHVSTEQQNRLTC